MERNEQGLLLHGAQGESGAGMAVVLPEENGGLRARCTDAPREGVMTPP